MEKENCLSCGAELNGPYCSACGEKVLTKEDKSLKKWLGSLFEDMTMIDGKLLLTLKELFFFPARYAKNYAVGIRKKYIKPLNFFFIANLLYFLFSRANTFKTSLAIQLNGLPYSEWAESVVENKIESEGVNLTEFEEVYNDKTYEISKVILIVLVPFLGFFIYLCFYSKGLMIADSFNIALQYWSFTIFLFLLIIPAVTTSLAKLLASNWNVTDGVFTLVILVVSGLYLGGALLPWRSTNWIFYSMRILAMVLFFAPLVMLYRFILFLMTLLLI